MSKPLILASLSAVIGVSAAGVAWADDCRMGSLATPDATACLTADDARDRRSLSPLLQLYDRPGASVDVTLRGRRHGVRPASPSASPPSATVTMPTRQPLSPVPPRVRAPRPGTTEARAWRAPRGYAYAPAIVSVARAYDIDPAFMGALIRRESGLNPNAVSNKGARGFMQMMPGTAARFGVRGRALNNPVANLAAGAAYLKSLQRRYGNNLPLILAAYNAGEGAVDRHGRRIPPYRETQGYVVGVLGDYGRTVARRAAAR